MTDLSGCRPCTLIMPLPVSSRTHASEDGTIDLFKLGDSNATEWLRAINICSAEILHASL
jgi:hypothetical protein